MEGVTETAVPLPDIVYVPGDRSASQACDDLAVLGLVHTIGPFSSLPLLGAEPQLLAPHLKLIALAHGTDDTPHPSGRGVLPKCCRGLGERVSFGGGNPHPNPPPLRRGGDKIGPHECHYSGRLSEAPAP